MRKRVYWVLKALYRDDMVSVYTCKLEGISSNVRNEIYELRKFYGVRITGIKSFVGRHTAYFLDTSDENINKVKELLKTHER